MMEERATSKEIRRLIREAISQIGLNDVAEIREYIDHRIGKPYTSGQLSGCFTNMCKSGELQNVERGVYRMGPGFEKKAGYYKKAKYVYTGSVVEAEGSAASASGSGNERFARTKQEIGKTLKQAADDSMKRISEMKIGEISVNDFRFIEELNQLNEAVRAFCQKHEI
ncbi:hypothetical protein [Clostridium sp. AM58-1XD]|uniref:hypothetical protein n=1 Tax=Clostridium sp. AM58-1XD TaxID=2292307 RepID=UPI000E543719|nr:hypothetical protein [Clostridium sp. AM58-1XD]RGY97587.1 hypothetical protein DXA13_13765 [Clostridium sp. AM58-1XD]